MLKILVAEDDVSTNKLLCAILKINGYEAIPAFNGEAALDIIDHQHIDLLLCDVMMPKMDGFALTQAIRDGGSMMPILMLTAKALPEDKHTGFLVGTDDYMTKPPDTGDLLDMILDKLQDNPEEAIEEDIPRFAVVGRPNAGKSSIINAFIGEDRNIVTEIAGTTRDSIYTRYDKFGFDFYLVDTAGIRRKNKVSEDLEFYSVMRSIRAIENSDVCILMLDATRGIETQDMNIFQLIQKNNKSLVVVVNKWDLVEEKNQKVIDTFENAIRKRMAPFVDFPIIFASALTKQRIFRVLETAKEVYQNRKAHIGTSKLNEVMLPIIEAYPPQSIKGKYIKIKYCTQLPNTTIPSFVFYANLPQYVKENYRRFLENKIRENWSLHGCPINVFIRQK